MIKSISSLLFYVQDLNTTFDFYKTLGFDVEKKDSMVSFYVNWFQMTFIDKEHSEFKKGFDEPKGNGMFIYVKVDNVDEYYQSLTKKKIKPSSEPKDWPWGNREFVVKDPDGYRLVFFTKSS